MKALIVDDARSVREAIKKILNPHMDECHFATNGQEAVDQVREALMAGEPFDLICLDIIMPEMDGQEALRKIREIELQQGVTDEKGAKIIMCTSLETDEHMTTAFFEGGCSDYLCKPITPENLKAKLREHGLLNKVSRQQEP